MKKNLSVKLLSLALALVCLLSFASCAGGGNGNANSPAGTDKLQKMEANGVSMDIDALASMAGAAGGNFECLLELKADGTFTLDMSAMGEEQAEEGTWKAENGKLIMTVDGEDAEATLNNGELVLAEDGASMTFKKK